MTTQPAYLTLQSGTSRYLTQAAATNYYLTLQDPAPYDNDVDLLLAEAVWYIDAHDSNYSGGQSVSNMGTAGTALNAQMGSGTAVDTNDPKWLAYEGTPYAYLPGVASNYLSVPDESALDITGDIDIRVKVALDDWTPSSYMALVGKQSAALGQAWTLYLNTGSTGYPYFEWRDSGGTSKSATATASTGFTDGDVGWVRVTLDVDNAGSYDVKFWKSNDGAAWTQIGSTVTVAATTSIIANNSPIEIGSYNTSAYLWSGKFYRAIVKNGIDGTTVLDIDTSVLTSGSQTTFTEQSSNAATVTVSRSTSGRKTTLVGGWAGGGSLWLFGTDDYMEVPDNDAIDFGASDSFTVVWVGSRWASDTTAPFIAKKSGSLGGTSAGWDLHVEPGAVAASYGNGAAGYYNIPTFADTYQDGAGLVAFAAAYNLAAGTLDWYTDGALVTPAATSLAASIDTTNASSLVIGRTGDSVYYGDFEFTAAAIWRRALTAGEIAGLNRYFQNRAYNG